MRRCRLERLGRQIDEGDSQDLPFGRQNTWRASLAFSQNIYSGGRIGAEAAVAAAGRETAEIALTNARGQLLFDATQAVLRSGAQRPAARDCTGHTHQADATLRQVQAGFDRQALNRSSRYCVRASARDNQSPLLIRQLVNREVALLRLKQLLDLPPTFDLQLADVLADETLEPPPVFAPRVAAVEKVMVSADSTAVVAQGLQLPLPRRAAVDAVGGRDAAERSVAESDGGAEETERVDQFELRSHFVSIWLRSPAWTTGERTGRSAPASRCPF